jgi:hypothetical protein
MNSFLNKSDHLNITIFISLTSYLRNWLGAGAFRLLEQKHNVTYLIPKYDWNPREIEKYTDADYVVINQNKWRMNIFRRFLQISMIAASKRSEAFRIKLAYANPIFVFIFNVFKINFLFNSFKIIFNWLMPSWAELSRYILKNPPDLFIAPSLLADSFTIDLSHTAKKHGIKTMILVNSWDNLISKGTLPFEPDSLVVWGANSIKHAKYVQRISRNKISILGVPRFEPYFLKNITSKNKSKDRGYIYKYNSIPKTKKIILYPATSLPFEDMNALKLIDFEISNNKSLSNYIVLFRPHPETFPRINEKNFFDQNFKNVLIDKQMLEYYLSRFGNNRGKHTSSAVNNTDLDYYPKLLESVDIVVSPATTMVLEALLLGKPVVMICYDDGLNKWLPPSEVVRYENVQELLNLPGVFPCYKESLLIPLLKKSVKMSLQASTKNKISSATNPIVYRDAISYSLRLLNLVNKVTSSSKNKLNSRIALLK